MTVTAIIQQTWPLLLQFTYILLQLTAINHPNWLTVKFDGTDYGFSLLNCEDCPNTLKEYTPECVLSLFCEENETGMCGYMSRLEVARDSYLATAVISVLAAVVVTVSQVYKAVGFVGEYSKVIYTTLLLQTMGSVLGVVVWFGETKATFTASDKQAETGAKIALAALIVCILATAGLLINEVLHVPVQSENEEEIGSRSYLGLTLRQWLYVKVFPTLFLAFGFDLLSLSSEWVQYRTSILHSGTLLSVDSYLNHNDIPYDCISGPACALNAPTLPDLRYCNGFARLTRAGIVYIWLNGVTLAAMLFWFESGVYYALGVEYGVPRVNYAWPVLALLSKLLGLVVWLGISQADLYSTCEAVNVTDDLEFCVTDGFIYALWELFCMTISASFFIALFYSRRSQTSLQVLPSISPSFTLPANDDIKLQGTIVEMTQDDCHSISKDAKASLETSGFVTMREIPVSECVVCSGEKDAGDLRYELPCGHWVHIGCFGKGGADRKTCPKCPKTITL